MLAGLAGGSARADEAGEAVAWEAPRIGGGIFSDDLGLLEREREQYANSLAEWAVNRIAADGASEESLEAGRRLLALSMHLAPRNRRALVANYQLRRGLVPEAVERSYGDQVLAGLMFTRASLLREHGHAQSRLLARIFVELAAELDPRNEDAVYASEIQRLERGSIDWTAITDVPAADGDPVKPGPESDDALP